MGFRSMSGARGGAVGGVVCQLETAERTVSLFCDYLAWDIQPCTYLPAKSDSPMRTAETHT